MNKEILIKPNEHSVYDIELTALTNKIKSSVENITLWPKDGRIAEDYGLSFAITSDEYLKDENCDPNSSILVVNPTANFYGTFLVFSLCFVQCVSS